MSFRYVFRLSFLCQYRRICYQKWFCLIILRFYFPTFLSTLLNLFPKFGLLYRSWIYNTEEFFYRVVQNQVRSVSSLLAACSFSTVSELPCSYRNSSALARSQTFSSIQRKSVALHEEVLRRINMHVSVVISNGRYTYIQNIDMLD